MNVEELQRFLAGQRVDFVGGLKIGEVAIISTTLGVIRVHEIINSNGKCSPRDYVQSNLHKRTQSGQPSYVLL